MVQRKFRKTSEFASSFDYLDLVSGVGYRNFYPAAAEHTGGVVYFLSTANDIISSFDTRRTSTSGGTFDIDFDVTFGVPATVANADAPINFTWEQPASNDFNLVFTLYHVRDSVETSMGSVQSETIQTSSTDQKRELVKITCTETSFIKGDKLRLNVVVNRTSGSGDGSLYHDPASLQTHNEHVSGLTIGSDLILKIPFVIDL